MAPWTAYQGLNATYQATFNDDTGAPITFAGTETLGGYVWGGGSLAALFNLTPTWATPSAGTVNCTVPGTNTASLAPDTYYGILTVVLNGATVPAFNFTLNVLATPGTTAARPTYITSDDLHSVAGWIDDLQNLEFAKAGFADQCADARDWMDQNILRNYRGGAITLLGMHGVALDAWFTGGPWRSSLDNIYIRQQLTLNTLMLTTPIKKAMVYYALSCICEGMIAAGGDWAKRQAYYQQKAYQTLAGTVAQLDINGDGVPEIPINFSSANSIYS